LLRRIVLTAVAGTLFLTVLVLVGAGILGRDEVETDFDRTARLAAVLLAERLQEPLVSGDRGVFSHLAARELGRGGAVAVTVFDRNRQVIAAEPAGAARAPSMTAWPLDENQQRRFTLGELPVEATFQAVRRGDDVVGGTWLAVDRRPLEQAFAHYRQAALAFALGVLGISWLLAWVAARGIVRPLEDLGDSLAAIVRGEHGARHPVQGPEEIRRLARRVNRLADQLEGSAKERSRIATESERQLRDRTRQIEQANRLLRDIGQRDPLTQLLNRTGLENEMTRYLSLCRRSGQPLAVIMMDLDSFKAYNDSWGHAAGDMALTTVSAALRARARVSDVVGRLGGDEFCIIIPFTKPERAVSAAEGFVSAIVDATRDLPRPETGAQLGASAGVACFPEDGDEGAELLARADAALYRAKAAGRGRVFRATPQQPGQQG
jgi:diguanylate cyclase (GGDEF)-like protein